MSHPALRSRMIRLAASFPKGSTERKALLNTIWYGDVALDKSWQADFPKTTPCVKCGETARHALTVMEEDGPQYASRAHRNDPDGEGFWLHDAAAFAIYLCKDIDCATATTLWNQG